MVRLLLCFPLSQQRYGMSIKPFPECSLKSIWLYKIDPCAEIGSIVSPTFPDCAFQTRDRFLFLSPHGLIFSLSFYISSHFVPLSYSLVDYLDFDRASSLS
jgi:hypothetical protein